MLLKDDIMHPSSALCRSQEALQRELANSSALANVRAVAARAAVAWGHEADAAEKREARHERTRAVIDARTASA